MASTSSQGPSPRHSHYDLESTGDTDESWQYIDFSYSNNSSDPGSIGFFPSPGSGSLNSYAIVGTEMPLSHTSGSPLPTNGDLDQPGFLMPQDASALPAYTEETASSSFVPAMDNMETTWTQDIPFLTPQQYLFSGNQPGDLMPQGLTDNRPFLEELPSDIFAMEPLSQEFLVAQAEAQAQTHQQHMATHQPESPSNNMGNLQNQRQFLAWDPNTADPFADFDQLPSVHASPTSSGMSNSSPRSTTAKSEGSSKSPVRVPKVSSGKIEKKAKKVDQAGGFLIVTPDSISAQSGKPNPYECFEHIRPSQRGRKGPLANSTKVSALQVRRLGACFCCHSRKVKCDLERPCKNCKKLAVAVPQVVCWQFQDFLTILFPDFIRGHLKKDEVAKFIKDSVDNFSIGGVEQPCEVELYSGPTFTSTLKVKAKFFTAKSLEVLQHWHLMGGKDRVDLQSNSSVPIGAEFTQNATREDFRKQTKAYVQQIIKEPNFAAQVTDSLRSTMLPRKVLGIVQAYAGRTDSTIVKRALSIYGMHYVITRHLCLTPQSIYALQPFGLVPQHQPWVTPRVLARQVKSLIDELMQREMQHLFDLFSKSLKPKYRSEWAPCLAAFLVLCLFMEAVETATDSFAVTENEVNLRNGESPKYKRSFALDMCKEVENMPFKQFAYQFHNIYQTHSKDANTKSFNPLFDDSFAEQGELDEPAIEMVRSLQELYYGSDWQDMQFLADDDLVISRVEHPFPRDPSLVYTGRLLSKFLLSFTNENAIFGSRV